ncbi:hypothetical protein PYCCODRAFT_1431997 [Trametes coccinea BRFM310]|uniref:25S rRNA (uridine-N(3))-methyltransferase BMT5-like domain-containing protein n=1 Tax=Trametes coccinea (strain BRFM310) TaxID=1353009 RepID=A0A1Y2IYJ6_TRAC3|nr:hypothetical protein PYCCODRAFT_1431997 [Trametes coccinea BRFM310]
MAKGGKKTSLKAALASQQTRLKKKQEVAHAAQHADRMKATAQTKAKGKAPLRPTIPFTPTDNILLIGEGNFSFAHALAYNPPEGLEFLPPSNITATAYDTEDECYSKYPEARQIVAALREKGVEVLFHVDATKLEKTSALRGRKFDRIMWNFPHAGKGITDQDRNILSNQVLLLGFLRSAAPFLVLGAVPTVHKARKRKRNPEEDDSEDDAADGPSRDTGPPRKTRGTILVTLRNVPPYTLWDLPKLAKNPPPPALTGQEPNPKYTLIRSFVFHRQAWKGYEHRMTKGERAHGQGKTGEGGEDRTWEFCLQD